MKIRKNNRGFTLVELLLVMAIIGILAGVIFVTTAPARKKARITTFKQHMKDLATAGSVCIDSQGTISAGTADGTSPNAFCTLTDGTIVNDYPEIKTCKGGVGSVAVTLEVPADATNDDFVLESTCDVTGTSVQCFAKCTVNGCEFTNDTTFATIDGCPKT